MSFHEVAVARRTNGLFGWRAAIRLLSISLLWIGTAFPVTAQTPPAMPGLDAGQPIPSIESRDQNGHLQTFDSLKGTRGLLLLFSRSADWCPYCKMHLLELQQAKARFEAKGIHVVSITYDSQGILREFAARRGITYPMLSDEGSKTIRAFGILNPEGRGFAAGIPYPGIYLISPDGKIERRFFEARYSDRFTPNDVYAEIFGTAPPSPATVAPVQAPHVTITLSQSDKDVGEPDKAIRHN